MCNTIWGKVNFRLELYNYWFLECSSEERQLTKVHFFSREKKRKKQYRRAELLLLQLCTEELGFCPTWCCPVQPFKYSGCPADFFPWLQQDFSGFQKFTGCVHAPALSDGLRGDGTQGWWEIQGVKVTQYKEKRKILRMIVQLLSFTSTELCRDLLSCATLQWNWFLYLTLFGKGIKEQKVQLCAGQKTGFSLPSLLLFVMWNVFCTLLQVELCVESWSQVLLM